MVTVPQVEAPSWRGVIGPAAARCSISANYWEKAMRMQRSPPMPPITTVAGRVAGVIEIAVLWSPGVSFAIATAPGIVILAGLRGGHPQIPRLRQDALVH